MNKTIAAIILLTVWISPALAGRNFNGTTQYINLGSALTTTRPFTVCAWVRPSAVTADMWVFQIGDTAIDALQQMHVLSVLGGQASDPAGAQTCAAGCVSSLVNGMVANTWQHICAVQVSATSRTAYRNGVAGTPNTSSATPSAPNDTRIARSTSTTTSRFFSGDISQVCVWSGASSDLNVSEIGSLAAGTPCKMVRPDKLISCPQLLGVSNPEQDLCGARSWTLNNVPTASTTNPPVGMSFGR